MAAEVTFASSSALDTLTRLRLTEAEAEAEAEAATWLGVGIGFGLSCWPTDLSLASSMSSAPSTREVPWLE